MDRKGQNDSSPLVEPVHVFSREMHRFKVPSKVLEQFTFFKKLLSSEGRGKTGILTQLDKETLEQIFTWAERRFSVKGDIDDNSAAARGKKTAGELERIVSADAFEEVFLSAMSTKLLEKVGKASDYLGNTRLMLLTAKAFALRSAGEKK